MDELLEDYEYYKSVAGNKYSKNKDKKTCKILTNFRKKIRSFYK